jgi:hypothetical protein
MIVDRKEQEVSDTELGGSLFYKLLRESDEGS